VREPFEEIAQRSGVNADVVMARITAMLRAGTIRRVRQTCSRLISLMARSWRGRFLRYDRKRVLIGCFSATLFRACGSALNRHGNVRSDYKLWDNRESAARIFFAAALRIARDKSRRGVFSSHAGPKGIFTLGLVTFGEND